MAWFRGWLRPAIPTGSVRLSVVSTPHPLALRGALIGGDPDQAGRSAQMDAFRQPEVPERLLLGEDRSGSGLEALCAASGLRPADTRQYLAVLTRPGGADRGIELVPGHGRQTSWRTSRW